MILLFGIPAEPPLRLLADACQKKHLPFDVFNQHHQALWRIETDPWNRSTATLFNGEHTYRLNDCTGLYLRTMDQTQLPEYDNSHQETIDGMYGALYRAIDAPTSCRIVNAPSVQMSNGSKPYQSLIIRECGLDIPDMCITSDVNEARQFIAQYKSVIYKSISGVRSIVTQVDESSLRRLDAIRYCPVQFQERITGFNVRVHTVGNEVFASRIITDALDYRYAHKEGKAARLERYDLQSEVAEKCLSLARRLRLPFAGIDLMMAQDGRVVCFEVNPSPGYSYYESHTGQPISHSLADYLACTS